MTTWHASVVELTPTRMVVALDKLLSTRRSGSIGFLAVVVAVVAVDVVGAFDIKKFFLSFIDLL